MLEMRTGRTIWDRRQVCLEPQVQIATYHPLTQCLPLYLDATTSAICSISVIPSLTGIYILLHIIKQPILFHIYLDVMRKRKYLTLCLYVLHSFYVCSNNFKVHNRRKDQAAVRKLAKLQQRGGTEIEPELLETPLATPISEDYDSSSTSSSSAPESTKSVVEITDNASSSSACSVSSVESTPPSSRRASISSISSTGSSGYKKRGKQKKTKKHLTCAQPGCDFTAEHSGNLRRHQHSHLGRKPYPCTEKGCSFSAAQKSDLSRHLNIHSGEKPFKCEFPECGYAAARRDALKNHEKVHLKHGNTSRKKKRAETEAAKKAELFTPKTASKSRSKTLIKTPPKTIVTVKDLPEIMVKTPPSKKAKDKTSSNLKASPRGKQPDIEDEPVAETKLESESEDIEISMASVLMSLRVSSPRPDNTVSKRPRSNTSSSTDTTEKTTTATQSSSRGNFGNGWIQQSAMFLEENKRPGKRRRKLNPKYLL